MVKEDTVSKILFSLSETDKNIQEFSVQKKGIEERRQALVDQLSATRGRLEELEGLHKEAESRRVLEEHRLRDEEQKIVERRKQLTAIGGAKSAKLVEREIDIASRSLETMEKSVLEAVSVCDQLDGQLTELRENADRLHMELEETTHETEKNLEDLTGKLAELNEEHDTLLKQIDERLKNLYRKVNNRYPGEAVALAKKGSCRSCYRALPAQLYNQVMAGNRLIQCPGCSRILVFADTENGG